MTNVLVYPSVADALKDEKRKIDDLFCVTIPTGAVLYRKDSDTAATHILDIPEKSDGTPSPPPAAGDGFYTVPFEPTEDQWNGLARAIVAWMDMQPKTPRALFKHLERSGYGVPKWLRDEPDMKNLDKVPPKGTRAAIIYKAMLEGYTNSSEKDS